MMRKIRATGGAPVHALNISPISHCVKDKNITQRNLIDVSAITRYAVLS
jgi:hypothetical protein